MVLTKEPPSAAMGPDLTSHQLDEQIVGIHGAPHRLGHDTLRDLLKREPLVVPTDNVIRQGFDSLIARLGVTPDIIADVDDMAMVRLLAREGAGV
ncbi:MAG: LysR family transcriptional regulator, partial [Paracoccaceae bacterium]